MLTSAFNTCMSLSEISLHVHTVRKYVIELLFLYCLPVYLLDVHEKKLEKSYT